MQVYEHTVIGDHGEAQLVEAVCYKLEEQEASLGSYCCTGGTEQRSWLRHCATSWKY
jgi:hypothetical protein